MNRPEREIIWSPPKAREPHKCEYKGYYANATATATIGLCNECGRYWRVRYEYPFFDQKKWVKVRWYSWLSHRRINHG